MHKFFSFAPKQKLTRGDIPSQSPIAIIWKRWRTSNTAERIGSACRDDWWSDLLGSQGKAFPSFTLILFTKQSKIKRIKILIMIKLVCGKYGRNFSIEMIENQIVNKAIDYIFSHLEQELSVEQIAEYCGFSKFYLSRLFKAETGESIYAFIKRLKVEQSAWRLKVEKGRSITEIGNEFGYSASNYATLFKEHFEKIPAQFRKDIPDISKRHAFFMVKIVSLKPTKIAAKK